VDIPRKIKVGEKWYSIEVVEAMQEHGMLGEVNYPAQKIKVSTTHNKRKLAKDDVQDTFWHELIHAILYDMGRYKLTKDEVFVTGLSSRLHKAIASARF
jgi:hypothetical protein